MFCPTCGKEIPNNSTFCLHCGGKINAPAAPTVRHTNPPKNPLNALLGFVMILGVVCVLIVGGFIAYHSLRSSRSSEPTILDTVAPKTPHSIVNQTFEVNPLSYVYFSFSVPTRAQITGNFYARGGKNDIEAVIFDEAGFENFRNGNLAERVYYNSRGYVTTATIDKYLPPGNYYLIFNNKDALLTSKSVTANIDAMY